MKILITGADGFIAKNLIVQLEREDQCRLYTFTKDDSISLLQAYLKEVDFIFHLAGVNRPKKIEEFYRGNRDLTRVIVDTLQGCKRAVPIVFSSSIQVKLNNDYAKSKLEAEDILLKYAKESDAEVMIYRLPNVFGKWAKPNYNSVIATWCHNITRGLKIEVDDTSKELHLLYIDDLIGLFISELSSKKRDLYSSIEPIYKRKLADIKNLLESFKDSRETLLVPEVANGFERALYATYLSYLPLDSFAYSLDGHKDNRGTFYEIIKTPNSGQFSLSTTAPGVVRGGHYHHTKNEKFLVVRGKAVIEFRHIVTNERVVYEVSDEKMQIVEMIPGYTHNIKNLGDEEMILFLWANENFDSQNPDTYYEEV
jgi:UDP-2-acetamido-2,6-beta-L-arabino-hexul-4-ose reductase